MDAEQLDSHEASRSPNSQREYFLSGALSQGEHYHQDDEDSSDCRQLEQNPIVHVFDASPSAAPETSRCSLDVVGGSSHQLDGYRSETRLLELVRADHARLQACGVCASHPSRAVAYSTSTRVS